MRRSWACLPRTSSCNTAAPSFHALLWGESIFGLLLQRGGLAEAGGVSRVFFHVAWGGP